MSELPFDLRVWVNSYERLAPSCIYQDARRGEPRSRAEKAARVVAFGRLDAVARQGPGVYLVRSLTKAGVRYQIDLDYLACQCEDHLMPGKKSPTDKRRVNVGERGVCWHILAALLADSVYASVQEERQEKREGLKAVAEMWG